MDKAEILKNLPVEEVDKEAFEAFLKIFRKNGDFLKRVKDPFYAVLVSKKFFFLVSNGKIYAPKGFKKFLVYCSIAGNYNDYIYFEDFCKNNNILKEAVFKYVFGQYKLVFIS